MKWDQLHSSWYYQRGQIKNAFSRKFESCSRSEEPLEKSRGFLLSLPSDTPISTLPYVATGVVVRRE